MVYSTTVWISIKNEADLNVLKVECVFLLFPLDSFRLLIILLGEFYDNW